MEPEDPFAVGRGFLLMFPHPREIFPQAFAILLLKYLLQYRKREVLHMKKINLRIGDL